MAIYYLILLGELGIGGLSVLAMVRFWTARDDALRKQGRRLSSGGFALALLFCLVSGLNLALRWEAADVLWSIAVGSTVGISIAAVRAAADNTHRGRGLAAFWSGIGAGLVCALAIFIGLLFAALASNSSFTIIGS